MKNRKVYHSFDEPSLDQNIIAELKKLPPQQDYDKYFEGMTYDTIRHMNPYDDDFDNEIFDWVFNNYVRTNPKFSSVDPEEHFLDIEFDLQFYKFVAKRVKQIDMMIDENPELAENQYNPDDFIEGPDNDWLDKDMKSMKSFSSELKTFVGLLSELTSLTGKLESATEGSDTELKTTLADWYEGFKKLRSQVDAVYDEAKTQLGEK